MEIDARGPVPVYKQIADEIARRIERGDLPPHRPIPSESDMVQEFGVARSTIRHAVANLRERGLVYTVPQRGTYAGKEPPSGRTVTG